MQETKKLSRTFARIAVVLAIGGVWWTIVSRVGTLMAGLGMAILLLGMLAAIAAFVLNWIRR
jgi:hypothetical protein